MCMYIQYTYMFMYIYICIYKNYTLRTHSLETKTVQAVVPSPMSVSCESHWTGKEKKIKFVQIDSKNLE